MIHFVFPLQAAIPLCCTVVLPLQPSFPLPEHSCSAFKQLLSHASPHRQTGLFLRLCLLPAAPLLPALPSPSPRDARSHGPSSPSLPSPRCPGHTKGESHRSVGFLLPGMFGCFAWLRRALHMHRVYDVKEIFHHSHAFQRDALGLRQSICPLQQCRQVELVSAMGDGVTRSARG